MSTTRFLDIATSYAERGWHVLPLRPTSKAPASKKGLLDATDNLARVTRWWKQFPTCNIGLRTGVAFDALDLDVKDGCDGIEVFDEWCTQQGVPADFSVVPTVATPSGGLHVYCSVTGAGNRAKMLPGVDWRGRNGYVVAAGSEREDGKYEWLDDWGATSDAWATPEQLHDLVTPPQIRPGAIVETERMLYRSDRGAHGTGYGVAALDDEIRTVAAAGNGNRNHQLNASGFVLFQLVAGGQLDESIVTESLLQAGQACGLREAEVRQTLESARSAGLLQPRRPPER